MRNLRRKADRETRGIFECDLCGMKYSTAWAKEKIQEIAGTVKVEGTVEVTRKVQMGVALYRWTAAPAKMLCSDEVSLPLRIEIGTRQKSSLTRC